VQVEAVAMSYVVEWSTEEDRVVETATNVLTTPAGTYSFGCLLEDPQDEFKSNLTLLVALPAIFFVGAGIW